MFLGRNDLVAVGAYDLLIVELVGDFKKCYSKRIGGGGLLG